MTLLKNIQLKPFLKWPGGKTRELKHIVPNLPNYINNYYEPFIGGGAVYFSIDNANKFYINDKSKDLIELYNNIKEDKNNLFINCLVEIDKSWYEIENIFSKNKEDLVNIFSEYRDNVCKKTLKNKVTSWENTQEKKLNDILPKSINYNSVVYKNEVVINLYRKMTRMYSIEQKKGKLSEVDVELNILTALKSAIYMYYRFLHNNQEELSDFVNSAIYYFIRNYTYSSMFRYNSKGEFNVPYGGMGYNKNRLETKISYLNSSYLKDRLRNTVIENTDFFDFFKNKKTTENDFVFLDPPYDTEFSTYDKNNFDFSDQKRLSDLLINRLNCNWMLVIKNTEFIHGLYDNKENVFINYFDKKYAVSFMNRNDRETEHLMITNYEIQPTLKAIDPDFYEIIKER